MDLFEKEGQDAFLNVFDTIERAADSILIQRKAGNDEENNS